jgi:hypothetical protein
LNLKRDFLVSKFAFKWVNLCRYNPVVFGAREMKYLGVDGTNAGFAIGDGLAKLSLSMVGLALPGDVKLVTCTIVAVTNWCFDCKIT